MKSTGFRAANIAKIQKTTTNFEKKCDFFAFLAQFKGFFPVSSRHNIRQRRRRRPFFMLTIHRASLKPNST